MINAWEDDEEYKQLLDRFASPDPNRCVLRQLSG